MTDITERLRDKWVCAALPELAPEAADTIETLRQRVKELEEQNNAMKVSEGTAWHHNDKLEDELAALKAGQGEWEDAVLGQHSITYASVPTTCGNRPNYCKTEEN